jgi:hypothetical protein
MQHAVNTATEEAEFSMWFAYIHCWATGISSMDPPQDSISSPVVNQKSAVERKGEWRESSAVRKKGLAED